MKRIGAYIYQDMTMLDVLGPHQILGFHPDFEIVTIAATKEPIVTDTGIRIVPDHDVHSAPDVDIVLTGGAADPSREMADPAVMEWFRKAGEQAEWVVSVCTGALILAEAGLLDGYRAATHWGYYGDLARYPLVIPTEERVVVDRNRMTAGGVTAGIDLAFRLVTETIGAESAAAMQLLVEYDPQPAGPFGHPRSAPPELIAGVAAMVGPMRTDLDAFMAAKNG
jgi:transcriptional regulator GlxA family with amidase domain